MNQQQPTYGQYPNPPQFSYPANPYGQAQQAPYPYPTAAPQSQTQYFAALPQQSSAAQQQQQQQSNVAPPLHQPRSLTDAPPSAISNQHEHSPALSPTNGPGAPPPMPISPEEAPDDENYEEHLINQLRRDGEDEASGDQVQNEGTEQDPVFHLPPPPEGEFPSETELEKHIHQWSLEHGYELVRRASKKNAGGLLYKRYYHCSRHGKIANTGKLTDDSRIRHNRKSNRMGCPMSLAAVASDPARPDQSWTIRHRKTFHNHGPLDALALAGHRRRARLGGVEKAVDGLFAIGTPTSQVLQFLQRTNPNGLFTRTDVANLKLKYKKYGTCVDRRELAGQEKQLGFPSACMSCRSRKSKCSSERPMCAECRQHGRECVYDHEPDAVHPNNVRATASATSTAMPMVNTQSTTPARRGPGRPPAKAAEAVPPNADTEAILANLQNFTQAHVRPARLNLSSSAVEVLATTTCGNGECYRQISILSNASEWPRYCAAFLEASLKENTHEVLVGAKQEPQNPTAPGAREEDVDVEIWNEYIKQLAIYSRRNTALLGAFWGSLSPTFRQRIQHLQRASEVWAALEDACAPRGSSDGFRLYLEMHQISLATSQNLYDYIGRLEGKFNQLNSLALESRNRNSNFDPNKTKTSTAHQKGNTSVHSGYSSTAVTPWSALHPAFKSNTSAAGSGQQVFTEESLCFLFLKGLGHEWNAWVQTICSSTNVGGFGTGQRLGFQDLTKRAREWEQLQSRGARFGGD